jgi:DNA-binding MarR family transcriptional regulator
MRIYETMIDLCSIRTLQTAIKIFEDMLKEETGLTLNEAMCLCALYKGVAEPGLLARELELSPSRLTRILDVLEQRAFISRGRSEADRRSVPVTLTRAGTKLVEKYRSSNIDLPEALAFTQK